MTFQSPSDGRTCDRSIAIVTGATGGMGLMIARALGCKYDLFLSDIAGTLLEDMAARLCDDGFYVCGTLAGDLSSAADCAALAQAAAGQGRIGILMHTAAVSPGNATWRRIVEVDLVGTAQLLQAFEPLLTRGALVQIVASSAGHQAVSNPQIDAILATPPLATLADRLAYAFPDLTGSSEENDWRMAAYSLAKRDNIRLCERYAPMLGARGVRIVSISPGMVWTPMGRRAADSSERSQDFLASTPLGRWGTSIDIAALVDFLASDRASFLTGCDILIDGGLTAALRHGWNSP